MTSTQVFGKIAGESAAQHAKKTESYINCDMEHEISLLVSTYPPEMCDMQKLKSLVKNIISEACSFVRSEGKCLLALKELGRLKGKCLSDAKYALVKKDFGKLKRSLECYHMINAGKAVVSMIKKRKGSIGPHNRLDAAQGSKKITMHTIRKANSKLEVERFEQEYC